MTRTGRGLGRTLVRAGALETLFLDLPSGTMPISSTRPAAALASASPKARSKSTNSKAAAELAFPATVWLQVLDTVPVKLSAE
jgi:hypothetical protein